MKKTVKTYQAWICPVHGLVGKTWVDYGEPICPINLSEDHITDDCCQKSCEGPLKFVEVPS